MHRARSRRQVLQLGGTAVAAGLTGCSGVVPPAADSPESPAPTTGSERPSTVTGSPSPSDPAIATPDRYEFDRVVHAVDDLGWDPTGESPVTASLEQNLRDGTLIEVPSGTYLVSDEIRAEGLEHWGLRGLGEHHNDVSLVVPRGRGQRVFNLRHPSRDILVENVTFDQYDTWDTAIGNVFHVDDGLLLRNVEYAGRNPNELSVGTSKLNVFVRDPTGVAVLDGVAQTGPTDLTEYPWNPLMVFSGRETMGTLIIRNCRFENCGEHAVYASRCPGDVRIENSYFRNNQNTHARISGAGSWAKDSTFVWDVGAAPNRGSFQATTGLTFESGFQGFTGGLVENCDFVCRDSAPNSGCLKVDGSHGAVTVRACRFKVDADGAEPVWVDVPGDSHMIDGKPERPWDVDLSNVVVAGAGRSERTHTGAVELRGRNGSHMRDLCIDMRGNRDGIVLVDSRHVGVGAAIDVPGEPLVLRNSSAPNAEVAVGGRCGG